MIQKIYQIELTNYCNLKCSYCPHSVSERPKGFMEEIVFLKTLDYISTTKQKLLTLHNFGEPLLHPDLEHFVDIASRRGFYPGFSTNGLLLTKDKFLGLVRSGLRWMCISLHDKKALYIFKTLFPLAKKEGVILLVRNIADNPFDLGDQVLALKEAKHDFAGTAPDIIEHKKPLEGHLHCDHIEKNYFVVLYDGTITACCMDEAGATKLGSINDMNNIKPKIKYELCENCAGIRLHKTFVLQQRLMAFFQLTKSHSFFMGLFANNHFRSLLERRGLLEARKF